MKIAICAPCHIPPSEAWVTALKSEAEEHGATVVIIDDSDGNLGPLPAEWKIFGYDAQKEVLGDLYDDFARMFHKSSACRVFGHVWAYKEGFEVIIGLDSDCIVKRNFIRDHTQFMNKDYGSGWTNPIGYPHYSRGYPYSQRAWQIKANMGLWENVLDINGKDRESNEPTSIKILGSTVPQGFFPFSGMNWAIHRDAIWGFLFLPNIDSDGSQFRRIDDVWGGYIFEHLLRKMKWSTMMGYPIVYHDTIVDAQADADEEEAMYAHEDAFIESIDYVMDAVRPKDTMAEAMLEFASSGMFNGLPMFMRELEPAVQWWAKVIRKFNVV
jgi:hypothetical protein